MRRRRHQRYSVHWAEQLINANRHEILKLCKEIEDIIIPPCNCVGKIWYRKLVHRKRVEELQQRIDELEKDGSNN